MSIYEQILAEEDARNQRTKDKIAARHLIHEGGSAEDYLFSLGYTDDEVQEIMESI